MTMTTDIGEKSRGHLPSVQMLRALAALLVVFGHVLSEARTFDPSGSIAIVSDWAIWTAGVDLFFVLSGFIMMWTFGERFGEPHASADFLKRRLVRILPPYWFFSGLMVLATLTIPHRLDVATFEIRHVVLSLLLVPHIAPHGGIHPILSLGWTLMYEMFFYATFALALLLPRRWGLLALCAAFVALHVAARAGVPFPLPLRLFLGDPVMLEFLLGVGFYFVLRKGQLPLRRMVVLIATCLLGLAVMRSTGIDETRLSMFGLPALALLGIAFWMLPDVKLSIALWLVMVGEASYTLYLSHPFVIEGLKGAVDFALPTWARLSVYVPAALIAATGFSLLFYRTIERHLPRLLLARLRRSRPRSVPAATTPDDVALAGGGLAASTRDPRNAARQRVREVFDADGSGGYRRFARESTRRRRAGT